MSSRELVCGDDKLQAALCKQLGYVAKGPVDLRQLAQGLMPIETDRDGQQTIAGLLEERHVQDGQGENV